MNAFYLRFLFHLRIKYAGALSSSVRKIVYQVMGMQIGHRTNLPRVFITWPHQVKIGNSCILENGIFFKYDGIWSPGPSIVIGNNVFIGSNCEFNIKKQIVVGDNCLIASGCRFIDHDHGMAEEVLIRLQSGPEKSIKIGYDVWLGFNVVVLKGVEIGNGSIVAAGSVVVKSILPNEIWGGVPAKKIKDRFNK